MELEEAIQNCENIIKFKLENDLSMKENEAIKTVLNKIRRNKNIMTTILCNNCIHKNICIVKKYYNNLADYVNKYDEKSEYFDNFHINISCKNYWGDNNSLSTNPYIK